VTVCLFIETLKIGIYDAVVSFNDGQSSWLALYKQLGLTLCKKSVKSLHDMDIVRVKKIWKICTADDKGSQSS